MSTSSILKKIVDGLSSSQKQAVLSEARYLRIVAAAGAGKTETLTRKIVYLIAKGEAPKSIIAFTFTERAAQEMKERIYRRAESLLGPEYCKKLGEMYVGTIHGFAVRLLQDHFGYGNYDVLDENQEIAYLLRHGWSLGLGPKSKLALTGRYSENCQIFLGSVNVVYDELIDIIKLRSESPDFAEQYEKYEQILDNNRLLTFGRLIKLAVEKISHNSLAIAGYKHLIVDEYQDINRSQEKLIKLLATKACCYIVGDPRQCIYQWRGSDPNCFERFANEFKAETRDILENRRSTEEIVKVANSVADRLKEASLRSPMKTKRSEQGTTVLVNHEKDLDEANWLASQVKLLVDSGVCEYQEIAILLRSVTTSGPKIIDEFKKRGIPYLVGGRIGLFKRDETQAVGRIFTWCGDMWWQEDPYNWSSQLQGEELLDSAIHYWPGNAAKTKLRNFKGKVLNGGFKNFSNAYQELLVILGFLSWDASDRQTAARMANLGRFNTLLTDFESSRRRGGEKPSWKKDLENLARFMNSYANQSYEEQPSEDLRGQPAVQIMTVHQAKGLEWSIVFIPALISSRFPSRNAGKSRNWLVSDKLFDRKRYEGGENDERKLFYVSVTRAKDALCLSHFKRINNSTSPSSFLDGLTLKTQAAPSTPFVSVIHKQETDEEEIISYSASEIIEYVRCPFFYRLRNVWGYQPGLVEQIGFGKSLHHILRILSEKAKAGEDPLMAIDDVMESEFHIPFARPSIESALRKKAKTGLETYIKNHLAEVKATEEVEARLEFQLTKTATVSGRVDVIIGQNGERELRDYKTADDSRTFDEAALQLRLYALGLKEIGQEVTRASIAAVMDDQIKRVEVETNYLGQARKTAYSAIEGILSNKFQGNPCAFCEQCDYMMICRFKS